MIKAKPTRYNGVLYRSKSEAMLAVCFDAWGWAFEYEPRLRSMPSFKPDFLIKHSDNRLRVIEYKPKRPTDLYTRDLFRKFRTLIFNNEKDQDRLSCELWCVDFWNATSEALFINYEKMIPSRLQGIEQQDFSFGSNFRFDLTEYPEAKVDLTKIIPE